MPMDYNLLEESWIPVLYTNGEFHHVGITEALTQATRIREIAANNPMDRLAVLRFLLAVLCWCRGNPSHGANSRNDSPIEETCFCRLEDNLACFDLFGDRKRFYQTRPIEAAKLSANYLVQEIPTGTNLSHFRHSTDGSDGLCPACCAMGLLRLPCFATSGGRGKPPGINQKPPVYVVPIGATLAETLKLSLGRIEAADDMGTPAWVEPDIHLPADVPPLTGLTWLPRRVWLDEPGEPVAACVSCGRRGRLVRKCVFAGIGSTKGDRQWRDPHVILREDGGLVSAGNVLKRSDAAAGQWADVLSGSLRGVCPAGGRLWVVGFATVQNDKYLETMEQVFPSPDDISQRQARIEEIARWQKEGMSLAGRLRPREEKAQSGKRRRHVEIAPLVSAIRPDVEARASGRARELLAGGEEDWHAVADEYRPMMTAVAMSLYPGATVSATKRRKEIAAVEPTVPLSPETVAVPHKGKGGNT